MAAMEGRARPAAEVAVTATREGTAVAASERTGRTMSTRQSECTLSATQRGGMRTSWRMTESEAVAAKAMGAAMATDGAGVVATVPDEAMVGAMVGWSRSPDPQSSTGSSTWRWPRECTGGRQTACRRSVRRCLRNPCCALHWRRGTYVTRQE